MKKIKNSILINLLVFLFAVIFSLVLGEIIVRIFYPQDMIFNISQWDPDVGFINIPGINGFTKRKDFVMYVKINSKGLRDSEYSYNKSPGTLRIGVFGDSFTFGEGVQNDETYPKVLERLLQMNEDIARKKFRVEVLNFGIGKSGTSHQLAFYKKEGKKYNLDVVVLGFLSYNDFTDNWGGVYYLKDGKLVHNSAAYSFIRRAQKIVNCIPFYKWLSMHSHLANLLRSSITRYDNKNRLNEGQVLNLSGQLSSKKTELAPLSDMKVELTFNLIKELSKEVGRDGASLIVVNLPAKKQKLLLQYLPGEIVPEYVKMWDKLLKRLNTENIKTLDLVPVFSKLPIFPYYFEHNNHMSKTGHQIVAAQIYDYMQLLYKANWQKKTAI